MTNTRDIFLDHAAATPLHPKALGLMLPYFGNHFGTPCIPFGFGDKPRAALEQALMDQVPDIIINAAGAPRLPHISSISFVGIQADALAAWLDLYGVTVSARAFFFSKRPPHALPALHIPPELAFGTIRFSPGWENSEEEILRAVEATAHAVKGMRQEGSWVQRASASPACTASRACAGRKAIRSSGSGKKWLTSRKETLRKNHNVCNH